MAEATNGTAGKLRGPGADGDTARSHDGGVKDSFPGRDVASITPFPGQPQRSVREVSADTRIRPGDNNTLRSRSHADGILKNFVI